MANMDRAANEPTRHLIVSQRFEGNLDTHSGMLRGVLTWDPAYGRRIDNEEKFSFCDLVWVGCVVFCLGQVFSSE